MSKTFAIEQKTRATPVRTARPAIPTRRARRAEIHRILHRPHLQTKLTVGPPDDAYEREADRVANAVMRMPEPGERIQRVCPECEEELQRQPEEEEEVQLRPIGVQEEELQTERLRGQTPQVTADVESRIRTLRGGGRPLPESVRGFFEPRFGHDFGGVRVHTGDAAAETAGALSARAFTLGRDVVFGAGQFAPESAPGRRLLAHELTHVVQQGASGRADEPRLARALPVQLRFSPAVGDEVRRQAPTAQQMAVQEQRVAETLAAAQNLLSASRVHASVGGVGELMAQSATIMGAFFPAGYGVINDQGLPTSTPQRQVLRTTVRRPGAVISRPFEFRVGMYLSHQTGGPAGLHVREGDRGSRIIFFLDRLAGAGTDDIAKLVAHELFHMWAHMQRVVRARFGEDAAALAPMQATSRLLDPRSFAPHRRTMAAHFRRLVDFLNAFQRRAGNIVFRRASETAASWARAVVEEVGAYVHGTQVSEAVATEQGQRIVASGTPAVTVGSSFEPVSFLRRYIRDFWLSDATDRAALLSPRGQQILDGMRDDILNLKRAMEIHMGRP